MELYLCCSLYAFMAWTVDTTLPLFLSFHLYSWKCVDLIPATIIVAFTFVFVLYGCEMWFQKNMNIRRKQLSRPCKKSRNENSTIPELVAVRTVMQVTVSWSGS